MYRYLRMATVALIFLCGTPALAAEARHAGFTQKDLARMIVERFGWNAGLPKEPADRDYLVILNGRRTFRYEAETTYNRATDRVTVPESSLYGQFTGKGWLLGVSDTTTVNFTVLLPIGGEYTLKAVIKGAGFAWKVGDHEFRVGSASGGFREVEVGKVKVAPGTVKITVTMPPEGAIDSYTFSAPDYAPIQPLVGWRFREPLAAGRLAEVVVAAKGLYGSLPEATTGIPAPLVAADVALPNPHITATTINYLGAFRSHAWLRADFRGGVLQMPLRIPEAGYYGITVNAMGTTLAGDVNGYGFHVAGKPYLAMTDLGLFRLEAGENMLTLRLPPEGGIDYLQFTRKSTADADFMKLAGINGAPGRLVTVDEARNVVESLYRSSPVRK